MFVVDRSRLKSLYYVYTSISIYGRSLYSNGDENNRDWWKNSSPSIVWGMRLTELFIQMITWDYELRRLLVCGDGPIFPF
jgi:hypothetical protein